VDNFLSGSQNFFFRLKPIIQVRSILTASLKVNFMGALPDLFFQSQTW
jgi:hypothetical protein